MKNHRIISAALALIIVFACNKRIIPADLSPSLPAEIPEKMSPPPKIDSVQISNNNQFAFELYREIKSEKQNVFFSPFSVSAAMAMTYLGARGESEKQIYQVMHFSESQSALLTFYRLLLQYINGLEKADSVEIKTANALWAQKDYPFLDSYFQLVTANYNAAIQNLDFRKEREKSRQIINQWVEEKTKNKIQELIQPGILTELTRLVIVNAIYYYALWEKSFNENEIKTLDFTTATGEKVKASFLCSKNPYRFAENEKFKIVEIPYKGKGISMLIILPENMNEMAEIEKKMSSAEYSKWLESMKETPVELMLPKFKTTSEFELSDALKKMGMTHPFSLEADFSGMTGKKDLLIDKVIHKAYIEVNEKGTEAAAATAVIIRTKNAVVLPVFRADRPFIFIIKENKYNNILFMGRINDPTK